MHIDNLVLRPNCLLTKYPLVFITGRRSLFFYEKLGGNGLQDYLTAHGYQVRSPIMPFRAGPLRKTYLQRWLKNQSENQFHFILSEQSRVEFAELFESYQSSTFTLCSQMSLTPSDEPLAYHLHRLFCKMTGHQAEPYAETLLASDTLFYDRFLDHCIELAENENL